MKKLFIIFGAGGHAKSVADVILFNESEIDIIFINKNAHPNEILLGFPVVDDYNVTNEDVFVAIGDNKIRRNICEKYYKNLISVISKRAYVGRDVSLGKGVFVAHNAHIGILSAINDFSVINTNASIDHECKVGLASTIAPGAVLCGKVTIGDNSWIGANASVKENISIVDNVIIGMGSIVIKDIDEEGTYVGCPAKIIHK